MAVTQNSYTRDGSATNYSFTFPYLDKSDVKVRINGVTQATTEYSFANATTLTMGSAGSSGDKLVIFRDTNNDAKKATFYAGSAIKSEDLNDNYDQILYVAQEVDNNAMTTDGTTTMTANLPLGEDVNIIFEGGTDNAYETTLTVTDPTADRTITLPNETGTVVTTGSTGVVTSAMITDSTIVNADVSATAGIVVSKLTGGGTARQVLNVAANGSDVEWTSNLVLPGTLTVTGVTTFNAGSTVNGNLVVTGTSALNGTATITTADINGGAIDGTIIGANSAAASTFSTLTTTGHATLASLQVNGSVASDLDPTAHATYDLGTSTNRWQHCYFNNVYSNGSTLHNSTTIGQNNLTTLTLNSKVGSDIVPTGTRDIGGSSTRWNKVWTDDLHVQNGQLNTLGGMQSGTASVLADSTALSASTTELNQLDGKTLGETTLTTNSDTAIPTSKAVNDRIVAVTNALGGFVAIADKDNFPTSHPDPSSNAGTVVSISNAAGISVNSSGVGSLATRAGGSDAVVINGFPSALRGGVTVGGATNADPYVLPANVGLQVQTTSTAHTYDYHKYLINEEDANKLSGDIQDFQERYRVASSAPTSNNDDGDLYFDTSTKKMKVYNAATSQWDDVASSSSSYIVTLSEAFDGSRTDFTMSTAAVDAQSTIVSINGVIQKPNAGTSTPSEGFAISSNTLKLSSAPPTGSDYFVVVLGDTVSIGTPSDNTVSTAKIQNLAVTAAKLAADAKTQIIADDTSVVASESGSNRYVKVNMNGTERFRFSDGASGGLFLDNGYPIRLGSVAGSTTTGMQLARSGDNAHIALFGTGDLSLIASSSGSDADMAVFKKGGAAELYHNGSKKFETTAGGTLVTGNVGIGGAPSTGYQLDITGQSGYDDIARLTAVGTNIGARLNLTNTGTGTARINATNNDLALQTGGTSRVTITSDGYVRLPNDTQFLQIGAGQDLDLHHNGTNSFIRNSTGDLHIRPLFAEEGIILKPNAAVELYYDNSKKLETTNTGIQMEGDINLRDSHKVQLGNNQDLQIYHDGSHSFIVHDGTGHFYIKTEGGTNEDIVINATRDVVIQSGQSESAVWAKKDGAVELYYDNSKKLETTSNGIQMLGHIDLDDHNKLLFGDSDDLEIYHNGSNSYILNSGTGNLYIQDNSYVEIGKTDETMIACNADGAVELYYDNVKKFETFDNGVRTPDNTELAVGNDADFTFHWNGTNCHMRNQGADASRMYYNKDGGTTSYIAFQSLDTQAIGILLRKNVSSDYDALWFANTNGNKGEITVTDSGTSYSETSDYRLKENIVDLTDGITRVKQLKPRRFNFKTDSGNTIDGFVAHEVSPVVHNAVTGEKDGAIDSEGKGYQGLDKSKLVPLLTAALQEAITKIETLETKVAALEAK